MSDDTKITDLDVAQKRAAIRAANFGLAAPIFAVLTPIAVLVATTCITRTERESKARTACLPLQMQIIDINGTLAQPTRDTRIDVLQQKVSVLVDTVKVICPAAHIPISTSAAKAALTAASANPNSDAARAIAKSVASTPAADLEGTISKNDVAAVAPSGPTGLVRLFLQINDSTQRAQAAELGRKLAEGPIAARKVAFQGVERVDAAADDSVRCFKAADLPACRDVVAKAQQQGYDLTLKDLSGRYEKNAGVRPGNVEIWLAPTARTAN